MQNRKVAKESKSSPQSRLANVDAKLSDRRSEGHVLQILQRDRRREGGREREREEEGEEEGRKKKGSVKRGETLDDVQTRVGGRIEREREIIRQRKRREATLKIEGGSGDDKKRREAGGVLFFERGGK